MDEASLLTQSINNFLRCGGKMAVPISFLDKAVREHGSFRNRYYISVKNAVYSLFNSNDGRYHYYELLDKIDNGVVNGKAKYARLLIWEVYPV